MKSIKFFILMGCLTAAGLISWIVSANHLKSTDKNSTPAKGFAVIELFTSEGCSSCPPADELVDKIQKENANLPVYILSFHVDYWNRLGWKDVFSDAAYSKRQNQYAKWLNLQSIYTPQIVVNGKKEFIGSQEGTLRNAIKAGFKKESISTLTLNDVKIEKNKITLQYQTQGISDKILIVLSLIQKSAIVSVKAGENGGRTLSHIQIVRSLQSLKSSGKGTAEIEVPAGLKMQNLEVIGFLQNSNNGEILAAASTEVMPVIAGIPVSNNK